MKIESGGEVKYHNKDKREAFISKLREAYHPLGLKWKTYTEINSLFNVRLKSYFFKGLEFAMLLRDSNDDLFYCRTWLYFYHDVWSNIRSEFGFFT